MSALLQLTDVRRNFGGVHAVDGVSLEIEEGTIFGLIGPNGAGKTTLVNLVTGYIRSQSGSIRLTSRSGPAELARRPPHATRARRRTSRFRAHTLPAEDPASGRRSFRS